MTEQKKIDGRTKRAADLALMKRTISRASYDAILAGTLTLAEARLLGRDRGPNVPEDISGPRTAPEGARSASAEDHQDTPPLKTCLCGCGEPVSRTFRPGHDSRLRSELMAQIKKGDVLLRSERITDEQRQFALRHGLIGEEALPPETDVEGSDV